MNKRLVLWSSIFFLLLLGLFLINVLPQPDENYITYRFARNLIEGHGLTYWTPDPPVTTYPVAPVLITEIAAVLKTDLPRTGLILAAAASVIGAICLAQIIDGGLTIEIVYIVVTCIIPSPVLLLMLAFSLGGLVAGMKQKWRLAGLLLGLAILTDPFALVLALLILIIAIRERGWKRYTVIVLLITAIGLLSVIISTGSQNIVAITPFQTLLSIDRWGFLPLLVLALFILNWTRCIQAWREKPQIAALVIWGAATVFVALSRQLPLTIVVIPGALAILAYVRGHRLLILVFGAAMLLFVLVGQAETYPIVQPDFVRNSVPSDIIATDSLGRDAFQVEGRIVDLSGQIMPQQPLDQSFFLKYIPDVVYTDRDVAWPSFKTTYAVDSYFYRRAVSFSALDDQPVDMVLGRGDMHLTGMAMGRILHPGDLVRVRLDWNLNYIPLAPVQIGLTLVDAANKNIQTIIDTLPPESWTIGDNQTYHILSLPSNSSTGKLELHLSVKYRDGTFIDGAKIGEAEVVH